MEKQRSRRRADMDGWTLQARSMGEVDDPETGGDENRMRISIWISHGGTPIAGFFLMENPSIDDF